MYRDNSLMPAEAIRLAALGALAERPHAYGELATATRQFVTAIMGPSLETMGLPLELLRHEGLIAGPETGLILTPIGREALRTLLRATLRPANTELNRLVIACKLRFRDVLDPAEWAQQAVALVELAEGERLRLDALKAGSNGADPAFLAWLDLEMSQSESRLAWYQALRAGAARR